MAQVDAVAGGEAGPRVDMRPVEVVGPNGRKVRVVLAVAGWGR